MNKIESPQVFGFWQRMVRLLAVQPSTPFRRSRHANMKELRAGTTRTLFAFDLRRTAILLLGGDKSGQWKSWYDRAIPQADDLYDEHLDSIDEKDASDG